MFILCGISNSGKPIYKAQNNYLKLMCVKAICFQTDCFIWFLVRVNQPKEKQQQLLGLKQKQVHTLALPQNAGINELLSVQLNVIL